MKKDLSIKPHTYAAAQTPEICALATLAACFANIKNGVALQKEAYDAAIHPVSDYVLRYDLFWSLLEERTEPPSPDSLLNQLCSLSDYYANVLRHGNSEKARLGGIGEAGAQSSLIDLILHGSIDVTKPYQYPMVGDSVYWERWDFEPAGAYRWFQLYLKMNEMFGCRDFTKFQQYLQYGASYAFGEAQTLTDPALHLAVGMDLEIAEQVVLGKSGGLLRNDSIVNVQELLRIRSYYHLFYWNERATQFDIWEQQLLKKRSEFRASQLLDTQYTAFAAVFEKVRERVLSTVPLLDPNEAIKAMQDIAKMLRLTTGYPTDKTPQQVSPGGSYVAVGGYTNDQVGSLVDGSNSPQIIVNFVKPVSEEFPELSQNDVVG